MQLGKPRLRAEASVPRLQQGSSGCSDMHSLARSPFCRLLMPGRGVSSRACLEPLCPEHLRLSRLLGGAMSPLFHCASFLIHCQSWGGSLPSAEDPFGIQAQTDNWDLGTQLCHLLAATTFAGCCSPACFSSGNCRDDICRDPADAKRFTGLALSGTEIHNEKVCPFPLFSESP